MAQRPTADYPIDPNVTSGTDLSGILNRFQDAIESGNSGASRPAYLEAGGLWVREGDPMRLYLYDGTTDRELYNTTDGLVGASQWKDNGNDIYYNDGNVGIGTDAPKTQLHIQDGDLNVRNSTGPAKMGLVDESGGFCSAEISATSTGTNRSDLTFSTREGNSGLLPRLTIDATGNVGIGMSPLRSTAKEQLAEWKSRFDARLREEPDADKKAVTLEITDDAFDELPTEDALGKWLETRAAGDRLQVDGNISASGTVTAGGFLRANSGTEQQFTAASSATGAQLSAYNTVSNSYAQLEYKANSHKFSTGGGSGNNFVLDSSGNATFSGSIIGSKFYRSGQAGFFLGSPQASVYSMYPVDGSGNLDTNSPLNIGLSTHPFASAYFSGGVYVNGSPLTRTVDLIETLHTLREATKDEETLEGLRDAIGDAIGGLIQKFEAIQAEAEKAATMDIEE